MPDIMKIIEAQMKGETINPPYTIEDMADDAVGLLDALGIEKAHICNLKYFQSSKLQIPTNSNSSTSQF